MSLVEEGPEITIEDVKQLALAIAKEMIKRGFTFNRPETYKKYARELFEWVVEQIGEENIPWKDQKLSDPFENLQVTDISPKFLESLSDPEVERLWKWLHQKWMEHGGPNRVTEDFLNANIMVQIERFKRGLIDETYEDKDLLDKEARYSWQEYPIPAMESPEKKGEITLQEVLDAFIEAGNIIVKGFPYASYACGRVVNLGKVPPDHDIDLALRQDPDPRLIYALKTMEPRWLAERLHPFFDKGAAAIGFSVPIHGYALNVLPRELMKKGFYSLLEEEPKLGKYMIGVKPRSGFGKNEFWETSDLWKNWGARYIDEGILVEEKVDGRRFQLHIYDDKVQLFTEDTHRDRASLFPELVEEIKSLKVKNAIIDGEMLVFETPQNFSFKNARSLREAGELVPREDTAVLTGGKEVPKEMRDRLVFTVYDIMYLNDKDLTKLPYSERRKIYLDLIPKDLKHIDTVRGELASSMKEFIRLVEKYRRVHGSEGVVAKVSSFKYPVKFSGENRSEEMAKCLTGGSYILTENGWQMVRDVQEGTLVFSKDGQLYRIKAKKARKLQPGEKLVDLQVDGGFKIRLTADHKILTSEEWIEAGQADRKISFFPKLSIPREEPPTRLELEWHGYKKEVVCDRDFWRLIGFWLAEGSIGNNRNKNYRRGEFELSQKDEKILQKYAEIIEKNLRVKPKFYSYKVNQLIVWDKPFCDWLSKYFLDKNDDKTIPWFINYLSDEDFQAFLEGYIEGDGFYNENGKWEFSTSDPGLAGRLFTILKTRGFNFSIYYRKPRRGRGYWEFHERIEQPSNLIKIMPCQSSSDDVVYDLEIENEESFLGPLVTLHNCKNLKEAEFIVLDVIQKKAKTGEPLPTWMYIAGFEIPESMKDKFEKVVERDGKFYAVIGRTYGTGQKAEIGDIITVMPIRIRIYEKDGKLRPTWMFPFFKEIRKDKKEPDTWTVIKRIAEVGTAPLPRSSKSMELASSVNSDLEGEDILIRIELEPCPFYSDWDICPFRKRFSIQRALTRVRVEEEILRFPVACPLSRIYKCRYLKPYYYTFSEVASYDSALEDGDTDVDLLSLPLEARYVMLQKYMEMPKGEHEFVMQTHILTSEFVPGEKKIPKTGSQHMDWRISVNGYLVGWSWVGGSVDKMITPKRLLENIGKGFRVEEKASQPKVWLMKDKKVVEDPDSLKPGDPLPEIFDVIVGEGEPRGKMFVMARGKAIFGVQKPYFHEYFLKGGPFKDWTRIVIRAVNVPVMREKVPTKQRELLWRGMVPKDQMPYAISDRAMEKNYLPPKTNPEPFPVEWTKEHFKEQYEKWLGWKESKKLELSSIAYAFSQHSYRGPIHVRGMFIRTWYLFLDDRGQGKVRIFRIEDFLPINKASVAFNEGRIDRKYLEWEGKTRPDSRFNPTKEIPGEMKILAKGKVDCETEDQDGREVIHLKFPSGLLQGEWVLEQEEKGSDVYSISSTESLEGSRFVYQRHYLSPENFHYDLRWLSRKDLVEEFNLFKDIREEPSPGILKVCLDPSWLYISKKEERKVGDKTTIVEPVDEGTLTVYERNPDFISFRLNGKELKGFFIAKKMDSTWIVKKESLPHGLEGIPSKGPYRDFVVEEKSTWPYFRVFLYDPREFTRFEPLEKTKKYLPELEIPEGVHVYIGLYPVPGEIHHARVAMIQFPKEWDREKAFKWIRENKLHTYISEQIREKRD